MRQGFLNQGFLKRSSLAAAALLAAGALTLQATDAEAAFQMRLSTGGGASITIVDDGLGDIFSGTPGSVSFAGMLGSFNINFTAGSSKPFIGTAADPQMTLTSMNANNSAFDKLTIELSDQGFTGPVPSANFLSVFNGTRIPGTASFETYMDTSNALFGTGTQLSDIGPVGPSLIGNIGGAQTTAAATSSPYSLTMVVRLDHSRVKDQANFDASLATTTAVSIPEPASLAVFGIGLLGLGGLLVRRRRAADRLAA